MVEHEARSQAAADAVHDRLTAAVVALLEHEQIHVEDRIISHSENLSATHRGANVSDDDRDAAGPAHLAAGPRHQGAVLQVKLGNPRQPFLERHA